MKPNELSKSLSSLQSPLSKNNFSNHNNNSNQIFNMETENLRLISAKTKKSNHSYKSTNQNNNKYNHDEDNNNNINDNYDNSNHNNLKSEEENKYFMDSICIQKGDCNNYPIMKNMSKSLKDLSEEILKLQKINSYLLRKISIKDELFIQISKEYKNLLSIHNSFKAKMNNSNNSNNKFNSSGNGRNGNANNSKRNTSISINTSNNPIDKGLNNLLKPKHFFIRDHIQQPKNTNINIREIASPKFKITASSRSPRSSRSPASNINNVTSSIISNFNNKESVKIKEEESKLNPLNLNNLNNWNINKNTNNNDESIKSSIIKRPGSALIIKEKGPLKRPNSMLNVNSPFHGRSGSSLKSETTKLRPSLPFKSGNNINPKDKANEDLIEHFKDPKESFYDKITEKSKVILRDQMDLNAAESILSLPDNKLNYFISNPNIDNLTKVTSNDDIFLREMRNYSNKDRLINYCDTISHLIRTYKNSIMVLVRIRVFLRMSNKISYNNTIDEITPVIIKNICELLNCDKASIFTHDSHQNLLHVHTSESLNRNIKIPCDQGIVGYVFNSGESQKIDDAYLDHRFNKNVDKQTGFRTKGILCIPLKDQNNCIFGVIQAINKLKEQIFTNDDLEILELFAGQISNLMKYSSSFDERISNLTKFRSLIIYNNYIQRINAVDEFIDKSEELLMTNFSVNLAYIYLFDKQNNKLVIENKVIKKSFDVNIGIVGMCFNDKKLYAFNTTNETIYFNKLIDLDTSLSTVTFPVINRANKEVYAVCQIAYTGKVNNGMKIANGDDIIEFFEEMAYLWISKNIPNYTYNY